MPVVDDKKLPKRARGPQAERLKLQGPWKDAVKGALKKKRPAGGWPKEK